MPQVKFPGGSIMVCGRATKDAEFKTVREKNSRLCKIRLAIGKRQDTTTIFVNVVAWHHLASLLATAQKGDSVMVWGTMTEPREYNGKTYQDLQADWLSVASVHNAVAAPMTELTDKVMEVFVEDDDSDLPF